MAKPMELTLTHSMNYSEPNDEDVVSDAEQLASGVLKLENYRPIRELERIGIDNEQALRMIHFSTPQERALAESLHQNTKGWIDTAKDILRIFINLNGLDTVGSAIRSRGFNPDEVARGTQNVTEIHSILKKIFNRSCERAVDNSNELLLAIDNEEHANQNLIVKAAGERHRNDLKSFQKGEVNVNVPHQSHAELLEAIKQAESNQESNVRQKAEYSSRLWDMAKYLGTIVLAIGVIGGMVLLKR